MRLHQQTASNPYSSCWVSASAGSGKTKVLIDRIIRLLLHSAKPERILCLTFSRAAAHEMQQRLLKRMHLLATASDHTITEELCALGETPNQETVEKVRQLFSTRLSQEISIQTVHSFCQSLLQRHIGKNILSETPRIMENFEESTYLTQAFEQLILNPKAQIFLEEFLAFHSDITLFEYLCKTTKNVQHLDIKEVQERLEELLDVQHAPEFPPPPTDIHPYLTEFLNVALPTAAVSKDHFFTQCFLTQKGTVRSKILSANIQKEHPEAEALLKIYGEKLANYFSQKIRFDHVQKSLHFWQLQQLFREHYKHLKESLNVWDFHDLIEKTLEILSKDTFDQILFDLNYRIDHILVDEAQDTSIDQWRVISHLVNGLFSQQSGERSLFVVGDEKQSIYSFQGADIRVYQSMQQHFSNLCEPFKTVHLTTSFRSSKDLLKTIDIIFQKNPHGLGNELHPHAAHHSFNGYIEFLPLIDQKVDGIEPWPIFTTYRDTHEPEELLAHNVLNHIEQSINKGLFLESEQRLATYTDVMILMRKRGIQMKTLTKCCEEKGLPYSAFDPQDLLEVLSVRDILSAVEFMLMPRNDLNLAQLLKSPWMRSFGKLSEDDLFTLCYNRLGHLWNAVQEHYPLHAKALNELLQKKPVHAYDYFQCAYDAMNIDCLLLHHFMDEALKRFNLLDLGIHQLIEHLYTYPPIFIQQEHQEGIKLSTVHGAKGLEAPIVIIIDNGEEPNPKQDIILYDPVKQFWFLKPVSATDTILTSALKEHHQQALEFEYNRLFYVALTRAKEHLILEGLTHEPSPHSWYWRVYDAANQ